MKPAHFARTMVPALLVAVTAVRSVVGAETPGALARVNLSEIRKSPINDGIIQNIPTPPTKIAATETVDGIAIAPLNGDDRDHFLLSARGSGDRLGCIARTTSGPMAAATPLYGVERVVYIRVERLLEENGIATLAIEHVFVDARTRGAKSVRTERFALEPVASFLENGHRRVYAYRNDASVHLIWPTGSQVNWRDALSSQATGASGSCGHAHIVLETKEPNGPKASATAVVTVAPSVPSASAPTKSSPPKAHSLRLTASVTQSTRDPEPILSVGVAMQGGPP